MVKFILCLKCNLLFQSMPTFFNMLPIILHISCCYCCCCCSITSVASDSVRPHRLQPTRLPGPWDSPGKNTGVGCQFLLQCMKVKRESELAESCLTLWTAAYQAPLPMEVSRQEYWSGVPLPWRTRLKWLSSSSSSQSYGFSNSHVWIWELDHKESWALKNWCF